MADPALSAKEPRALPPGKATEYFRKANGSWPPDDDRFDPELHRLMGCPCQKKGPTDE